MSSLLDIESKYNRAIEEKTLLEQEVIQRQELEEENQRLKDDVRGESSSIEMCSIELTCQMRTTRLLFSAISSPEPYPPLLHPYLSTCRQSRNHRVTCHTSIYLLSLAAKARRLHRRRRCPLRRLLFDSLSTSREATPSPPYPPCPRQPSDIRLV